MFDWLSSLFDKFTSWLVGLFPDWLGSGWAILSDSLGPTAKYFVHLFALDITAPTIMSAYVIRFLIRRTPLVG